MYPPGTVTPVVRERRWKRYLGSPAWATRSHTPSAPAPPGLWSATPLGDAIPWSRHHPAIAWLAAAFVPPLARPRFSSHTSRFTCLFHCILSHNVSLPLGRLAERSTCPSTSLLALFVFLAKAQTRPHLRLPTTSPAKSVSFLPPPRSRQLWSPLLASLTNEHETPTTILFQAYISL